MSTMDGLNAGAATFTPGGGAAYVDAAVDGAYGFEDNSENNAMMDEIEAAIIDSQGDYTSYDAPPPPTSSTTTYTDLPPHADEFWFPECRNCTCCNGYKHGCQCCAKEGLRSCKCAPSTGPTTTVPTPSSAPPPPAVPASGWMPAAPGPGTGGGPVGGGYGGGPPGGYGGHGHPHQQQHHHQNQQHPHHQYQGVRGGGGGGRGNPPMCRFFTSPAGCRFGDKCRFSHG